MSLINDALKQAGEHQKKNPPPPSPLEFRAAEESPRRSYTPSAILLGVLFVVLALGGVLIGVALQKRSDALKVNARTNTPEATVPLDTPSITPAPTPQPELPVAPIVAAILETNVVAAAVAPVEPPKPVGPKLQGISYTPARPSAIVSGKTVYPGDRFGEFKVTSITPKTVTLTGDTGETRVLSLSE